MSEFYNILKRLRLSRGLMQKEVADALGISKSSYCLYESGNREPNLDMLQKISIYFGVTVDYLMGLDRIENAINEANQSVLNGEKVNSDDATKTFVQQVKTLAAHFDGDEYTEEELEKIKEFAAFVKANRK